METVTWLWLYDKRWMFGVKAPNLLKVWAVPLVLNALFLASLLYYSFSHGNDECYSTFQTWIDVRMYLLIALIFNLTWIMLKANKKMENEDEKVRIYRKTKQPQLAKRYTYWLRRRMILSYSGTSLILMGLFNWIWTLYGMNMVYESFSPISRCEQFMQDVVWGNLIITGIFALPVIWIMFWMVIIKGICLTLSVVCPNLLIWIKKKAN